MFLLLLCNDRAVLGPWVNGRWQNLFTGGVVAALVMLSIILTAAVLFPDLDETMILTILGVGTALAILAAILAGRTAQPAGRTPRRLWRMPKLETLPPPPLNRLTRAFMIGLRVYVVGIGSLVLARIVLLATGHG